MKRFYLAPTIGDGSEEDSFRPAIANYSVAYASWMPDVPVFGKMVLVEVATNDHSGLLADAQFSVLPAYPVDLQVSSMNSGDYSGLVDTLNEYAIPDSAIGGSYWDTLVAISVFLNEQARYGKAAR